MKKISLLISLLIAVASLAMAATPPLSLATYTASGATSGTVTANAITGLTYYVTSILATSDKAGSVVAIQKANATGVTNNYTTVGTIAVGAASTALLGYGNPLFAGSNSYSYRFVIDSTTANSLMVTGHYE